MNYFNKVFEVEEWAVLTMWHAEKVLHLLVDGIEDDRECEDEMHCDEHIDCLQRYPFALVFLILFVWIFKFSEIFQFLNSAGFNQNISCLSSFVFLYE